jgi:hypothetical protein
MVQGRTEAWREQPCNAVSRCVKLEAGGDR